MASLLKQCLVNNDAERLIAVSDRQGLAVLTLEVKGIGGHLIHDGSAIERIAVVTIGVDGALISTLEQGRSGALVKLGCEGGVIGAGSSGDNLDGNAGLLGIGGGELLPSFVSFGLEVQVVDGAGSGLGRSVLRGLVFLRLIGRRVVLRLIGRRVVLRLIGGVVVSGLLGGRAGDQSEDHDQCKKQCDDLFHVCSSIMFNLYDCGDKIPMIIVQD